jgi:hypothetical protein
LPDGIAVDANVMKKFNQALLSQEDSLYFTLIDQVLKRHGLVIDIAGKVQYEWFSQCPNALFKEWFIQNMKLGLIRMVKPSISEQHKRALVIGLGFPRRGYDIVYVAIANVTVRRYIVTDDLDFFDPTQKQADHETKERIKRGRKCAVCAYLRRHMSIVVGTPEHASAELLGDETQEATAVDH